MKSQLKKVLAELEKTADQLLEAGDYNSSAKVDNIIDEVETLLDNVLSTPAFEFDNESWNYSQELLDNLD